MKLKVYLIRHISTGDYMPQMRRGKGYSWWNPGTTRGRKTVNQLEHPRIFTNKRAADIAVTQWFHMPNTRLAGYPSDGGWEYDLKFTDDGRKKSDLEVVEGVLSTR